MKRTPTALTIVPLLVAGCSSPSEPPPPPGGGVRLELSLTAFTQSVAPVLTQHGCDAGGNCHGGGIRGTFELSPPEAKDAEFDFEQASLQVNAYDRDLSPLLMEPLAQSAGGGTHAVQPFASTDDPGYQAIRAWILAGEVR
jgi:hypothetical protein